MTNSTNCPHSIYDRKKVLIDGVRVHQGEIWLEISTLCKCDTILTCHYTLPLEFIDSLEEPVITYDELEKTGKKEWDNAPVNMELEEKEMKDNFRKRHEEMLK